MWYSKKMGLPDDTKKALVNKVTCKKIIGMKDT